MRPGNALTPAPTVLVTAANPYDLQDWVRREYARRAILLRQNVQEVQPGLWGVVVVQLKPPARKWVRPAAVVAATGSVLAGGGYGLVWLVQTATAVLAGLSVAGVAVALALAGLLVLWRPRSGGGCTTEVRVTHRHH